MKITKKQIVKLANEAAGPAENWLPYEREQYIKGFVDGMRQALKMANKKR